MPVQEYKKVWTEEDLRHVVNRLEDIAGYLRTYEKHFKILSDVSVPYSVAAMNVESIARFIGENKTVKDAAPESGGGYVYVDGE